MNLACNSDILGSQRAVENSTLLKEGTKDIITAVKATCMEVKGLESPFLLLSSEVSGCKRHRLNTRKRNCGMEQSIITQNKIEITHSGDGDIPG
jgi:hypothetical protein